jgi:hypothetical protein
MRSDGIRLKAIVSAHHLIVQMIPFERMMHWQRAWLDKDAGVL